MRYRIDSLWPYEIVEYNEETAVKYKTYPSRGAAVYRVLRLKMSYYTIITPDAKKAKYYRGKAKMHKHKHPEYHL